MSSSDGDEDVSMVVFWVATPYELLDYTRVSEKMPPSSAPNMEKERSTEKLVPTFEYRRCYYPEGKHRRFT
jgi:hypothetical protein